MRKSETEAWYRAGTLLQSGRLARPRGARQAEGDRGLLDGACSDGHRFRLDPKKLRVENLGKPLSQYRTRSLVFARNGKLCGVGGGDDEMARLFSCHPPSGVYDMLGMIDVNGRPYDSWHAYRIGAVALGADGTVSLGQVERGSRVYLYHPE